MWFTLLMILLVSEPFRSAKHRFRPILQLSHIRNVIDGRKLVGGQRASIRDYRFFAAVWATKQKLRNVDEIHNVSDWDHCSGTLFREDWVLTAAHCVVGFSVVVIVNAEDYIPENDEEGRHSNIMKMGNGFIAVQVIVHPSYFRKSYFEYNYAYDIALLKLTPTVVRRKVILPLASDAEEDNDYVGRTILILGRGYIREPYIKKNLPNRLQKLWQWVQEVRHCKEVNPKYDHKSTMCLIGNPHEWATPGDSGGPYVAQRDNKELFLIGVHAGGTTYIGANILNYTYGTRIRNVSRWIERQVYNFIKKKQQEG